MTELESMQREDSNVYLKLGKIQKTSLKTVSPQPGFESLPNGE